MIDAKMYLVLLVINLATVVYLMYLCWTTSNKYGNAVRLYEQSCQKYDDLAKQWDEHWNKFTVAIYHADKAKIERVGRTYRIYFSSREGWPKNLWDYISGCEFRTMWVDSKMFGSWMNEDDLKTYQQIQSKVR